MCIFTAINNLPIDEMGVFRPIYRSKKRNKINSPFRGHQLVRQLTNDLNVKGSNPTFTCSGIKTLCKDKKLNFNLTYAALGSSTDTGQS